MTCQCNVRNRIKKKPDKNRTIDVKMEECRLMAEITVLYEIHRMYWFESIQMALVSKKAE